MLGQLTFSVLQKKSSRFTVLCATGVPFALDGAGNAILYHVAPQLVMGLLTSSTVCTSPTAGIGAAEESAASLEAATLPVVRCVRYMPNFRILGSSLHYNDYSWYHDTELTWGKII